MRKLFLAGLVALAASASNQARSEDIQADQSTATYPVPAYATSEVMVPGPPCALPVTKIYRINPGYCPQALVHLIPKAVGPGCCGCECGPYGIPPIYASGQNVLVRQTPEMQERIAEFLTEMGALVPRKR